MAENVDYKAILEKIASLMTREPHDPSTEEDFNPDDYAGGNIDDAWYNGYEVGRNNGMWEIVCEARRALGLDV